MAKGSGRRPLPTAVKKLRGNPGKRKLNPAEPKLPSSEPVMPRGLSKVAAAEWRSIVPELVLLGVLTRVDGKALAAYCHCFARWFEAEKEVQDRGIIVDEPILGGTPNNREIVGYRPKRNPAVSISNDALRLMRSYLVEFGMTPSSRTRIRIEKPEESEDPFEKFLQPASSSSNVQTCQLKLSGII